ncbi:MAG: alpha/beta fold hydrolase [Pikeienuella sp.]|uniref:alpha/beta fold hydrolase n=1 Tax=Pikeienuella sp. TaxID=2831957 RepID=UPI00391A1A0C
MQVKVNGVRLYFDVEGMGLVPDGPRMRKRPTLLLLHGGPGADHSIYKPDFAALADVAQVIWLDHRGAGRSEAGDPALWTLAQWGEDVHAFCETLGIERPVVYGASFGGFVAQAYATARPEHPAGLILASTAARFDFAAMIAAFGRIGGPGAEEAAAGYWLAPSAESRARYHEICLPLYTRRPAPPDFWARIPQGTEISLHFNGPGREQGRFDYREALARLACPTLVLCGEDDPVTPIPFSEEIARCAPPALTRFERLADCGHGVTQDQPERAFALMRDFIRRCGEAA